MKRHYLALLILLSFTFLMTSGCSSAPKSAPGEPQIAIGQTDALPDEQQTTDAGTADTISEDLPDADPAEKQTLTEAAEDTDDIPTDTDSDPNAAKKTEILLQQNSETEDEIVLVVGVFARLEDNHTAIFSFDGMETAFYFDEPDVQKVLYEAVVGTSYTLSYRFDSSLGLNSIYEITEN